MPKNNKRLNGQEDLTPEEIAARKDEKFRTFFSTSVAQVPDEMNRRMEQEDNRETPSKGLFGKLFHREKAEKDAAPESETPQEMPTGEVRLGGEEDEPQSDLQLAVPAEEWDRFNAPEEPTAPAETPAEPDDADFAMELTAEPEPAASPEPEKSPSAAPEKQPEPDKPVQAAPPRAPLPQEEKEHQEMQELKAMLYHMSRRPEPPAPQPEPAAVPPAEPEEPQPEPKAVPPAEPQPPLPRAVFAEDHTAHPAAEPPAEERVNAEPAFRFFGVGDDEVQAPTRTTPPSMDDSMSLPLVALEEDAAVAVPEPPETTASDAAAPASGSPAAQGEAADPAEPAEAEADDAPKTPEEVGERLRQMGATLTLRCVLSGILALVLLAFGLMAEGLLAPMASLDPAAAPAAFYAANLLLLAAAMVVGYPILRDGLTGLKKESRPSAETMPALAACGAALEAVVALLHAGSYQPSSFTLLSGIAALGLCLALMGDRVMLAAVKNGYDLAMREPEHRGAFRVKDKDLIRTLARSLEQEDPWILLSRKADWSESFLDLSFSVRASERRAQKTSYILLGAAVLSGLVFLLFGGGINGMAAASTAMLCMGAPLSSTLIAGLAALRLQKSAETVGAVVPGWASIEELGGVDTVQVDSDDLFTLDSVTLEDIRIFKGGRIDRAILYTASVLNQSCETLRGLFRQIIEDKTEILYPVKDLEIHRGLGFAAWCDNNRILIGNRAYLESEGVTLPEIDYENEHSKNGSLQILYLAVSGSLHAMFVLRSVGGRNAARGLEVLQKENIRLLVSCLDPSLTARHITEAYHLPEGMVSLLDQEQCRALEAAEAPAEAETAAKDTCCMIHTKGFASMTGGLRAAEQAQNAETTATTVQMVSVWFSVVIGVLLTYAGSIGFLSVAAVLMYQAAWSGLSIAVCALKQHN